MTRNINTFTASGSWGTLTAWKDTGMVVSYDDEGNLPDPDGGTGYANIVRLDVDEWRRTYPGQDLTHVDILDIGTRDTDGEYVGPEYEWREQVELIPPLDEQARAAVEGHRP